MKTESEINEMIFWVSFGTGTTKNKEVTNMSKKLFAGSKGDKDSDRDIFNGRDMFSCRPVDRLPETPTKGPIISTATDPNNPPGTPGSLDLTSKGPYKLF